MEKKRCSWVNVHNPLYRDYHDYEWGECVYEDKKLFEMLVLEGAQAGLSWETILKKRNSYKKAFDNFDPQKVSQYNDEKIKELLHNTGIVRNLLKIQSAIKNAKIFLKIQEEYGSFCNYIWSFVKYTPIQNTFLSTSNIPTKTQLSDTISKDLKKRGMSFVGSTIIYSFMQAIGMVNDHENNCFKKINNSYFLTQKNMKIFGILAYPVHHSLSPQIHNAGIMAKNINAIYTRFGVAPRMLKNFIQENFHDTKKISGLSVSIPHKETCKEFLDEISPSAKKIGAVNTIYWKNNTLCGTNTDYIGFSRSISEKYDIKGKKVLVLGAGGATKAILFALEKNNPKKIFLWNRTYEKAKDLSKIFSVEVCEGNAENLIQLSKEIDLIINTTSLGMKGKLENLSPIPSSFWRPHHTAFDIVYTPLETRFLRECQEKGGTGISGEKMLLFQAIAQFEIFTGEKVSPEIEEIMKNALIEKNIEIKTWAPPKLSENEKKNILKTIINHKKTEIYTSLEFFEQKLPKGEFLFSKKLREKRNSPHLIAEIKPASPSKGKIFKDSDSVENIAKLYEKNGASCISVLTDYKFFGATIKNLQIARKTVNIPLLRKDFIIHPAQIFEARFFGADAVLLMKSILPTHQIEYCLQVCRKLGMDALVEVHNITEFSEVITQTSAEIIGINSRDLKTLQIDQYNFQNIINFGEKHFREKMKNKILVSESGISSQGDIQKTSKNANAVLVGTAILLSKNRKEKIQELSANV